METHSLDTDFEYFNVPEQTIWREILACKYKRRVAALQAGLMMDLILHHIERFIMA